MNKLILAAFLLVSLQSNAHHSDAGIDESTVVSFEGTVIDFRWRQPHVYVDIETSESGEPVVWSIQMAGINSLSRQRGWNSESLESGDEVFVRINPAENGKPFAKLSSIQMQDGSPVEVAPGEVDRPKAQATSFEGNSLADRNRVGPSYPGGFDGFFHANLVLTDAAKQAQKEYDPLSPDNPESTCVGRPTPSAFVSTTGYLIQFNLADADEKIILRSEWFNEKRTIYMDGREHPDPSETFVTGHSIGHWEDDTLVIDTRNFDDHRSPYQIGVPSGSQKHVIEKYRLIEDGTAMYAEFVLSDPEYLAEPFRHERVLLFSPHLDMLVSECDIESSSEFLQWSTN